MRRTLILALSALAILTPGAVGHGQTYVGLVGDLIVLCNPLGLPVNLGGVCFDAGHLQPNGAGIVVVRVHDTLITPVSGTFCEDRNADAVCGNGTDLVVRFCSAATIFTSTPLGASQVQLDGPLGGNPVTSPCGVLSIATVGSVTHT